MTASELRLAIGAKQTEREQCAHRAHLLATRCAVLREDNPWDWRIKDLSEQVEALDEHHDKLGDEIGEMQKELWLLDAEHSRRCVCLGLNGSEY